MRINKNPISAILLTSIIADLWILTTILLKEKLHMSKEIHIVFRVLNFIQSEISDSYNLSDSERLLLITLASHNGPLGICPSIGTIAKKRKLEVRAVRYALKKLSEKKLISIVGSVGKRNDFILSIPDQPLQYDAPVQSVSPLQHNVVDPCNQTQDPCNATSIPLQPIAPNIINNKQLNITTEKYIVHFDQFWNVYPKKINKKEAQDIWTKKNLDSIAQIIINHIIERTAKDRQWQNEQYIPHPTTFLANEKWNDEFAPIQTSSPAIPFGQRRFEKSSDVQRYLMERVLNAQRRERDMQ